MISEQEGEAVVPTHKLFPDEKEESSDSFVVQAEDNVQVGKEQEDNEGRCGRQINYVTKCISLV